MSEILPNRFLGAIVWPFSSPQSNVRTSIIDSLELISLVQSAVFNHEPLGCPFCGNQAVGVFLVFLAVSGSVEKALPEELSAKKSWITENYLNGPIYLIPRLKAQIDAHYPGTKLAFTEYSWGGGDHISGGIAQADVLGIFGREDVFAATIWHLGGEKHLFVHGAVEMYRNYDGKGGAFGDTSIQAVNSDHSKASVYAAVDAGNPNRMT